MVGEVVAKMIYVLQRMSWLPYRSALLKVREHLSFRAPFLVASSHFMLLLCNAFCQYGPFSHQNIVDIAGPICEMEADIPTRRLHAQRVPGQLLKMGLRPRTTMPLTSVSVHLCFRLTYIIQLLKAFGIDLAKGGHLVQFHNFGNFHTKNCPKHQSSLVASITPPLEREWYLVDAESPTAQYSRRLESSVGMILRQVFSDDTLKNLYILGAAHWKHYAFMSPIDDAIQKWLREHPIKTEPQPTGAPNNITKKS